MKSEFVLDDAIEALRNKDKPQAREILENIIQQDPQNDAAWVYMALAATNRQQALNCLERATQINPANNKAWELLEKLKSQMKDDQPQHKTASYKNKPNLLLLALIGVSSLLVIAVLLVGGLFISGYFNNGRSGAVIAPASTTSTVPNTDISTQASTSTPTKSAPPTWTPTPQLTPTPFPTKTPLPINTSIPTWTPYSTATPIPTVVPLLGKIDVDQWELLITGVESLPGRISNQQIVIIFVTLTNRGSVGTFSPYYTLELMDTQGRRYTDDIPATGNARNRYGIDIYADVDMPPDSTADVLYAYIAPVGERRFTIVPGSLVSSWSGNVTFSLP